ncbi:MAG: Glu-tRNA(Gln) amidotransferase subunit GatD [Candidatus Aenigmatarchaeota archaeon]
MYSQKILNLLKAMNIALGDKILIRKNSKEIVGILMPKPLLSDPNCLTIKLDDGYNIGIASWEEIRKVEEKPKHKEYLHKPVSKIFNKTLPTISILGTGGTIASKIDYRTGGVYASFSPEDIINQIPELEKYANIKSREIMNIMSEDITPEEWIKIAKEVANEINSGSDGVIITHGTDTMHFTATALGFMLMNLPVPVVLVGAQRSSDRGSSDASMNVICAANFIAKSDVAEVCIVMHGNSSDEYCIAIRGCKCRKMHTSSRDAFKPINDKPIAKIYYDGRIEIINKNYKKKGKGKVKVDSKLEKRVALIKVYPGLDPDIFDFYIDRGCKGFVIEATGLGHVPTLGKYSLLDKIEKAEKLKIPVVITSQCLYGRVHPTVYHNLRELSKRGAIFAEDILPEVAYIKLMHVLGHTNDINKIRKMMLTNMIGEISDRTL